MASDDGRLDADALAKWAQSPENSKYVSSSTVHALIARNNASLARLEVERQKALIQVHSEASIAEAQRQTDAALSSGQFWRVNGQNKPQVLTATGTQKDFDTKAYAEQRLEASTKDMPFDQQVASWSQNGITNPDWQNRMRGGFMNLSTIGVDSKGKPVGELNEEGKASLQLFQQLNAVNPEYAKQVAGEEGYKRFGDISFLQHMGRDISSAAGIAASAASGNIASSDVGNMTKKVNALTDDLLNNPWYKPDFLSRMFGDNVEHNTAQVASVIRRYATLLTMSGQYGSADQALEEVGKYLSSQKVTTQINGTLYMRSELPQAPDKESQDVWFEKFITKAPKAIAKEQGYGSSEIRLEFDSNIKAYRVMSGSLPIGRGDGTGALVYSKSDIQEWYAIEYQKQINTTLVEAQDKQLGKRHGAYSDRIKNELKALQGENNYVLEQYDPTLNHVFFNNNIIGEQAFRRIEKEGNADKHLRDLMQIYTVKRK